MSKRKADGADRGGAKMRRNRKDDDLRIFVTQEGGSFEVWAHEDMVYRSDHEVDSRGFKCLGPFLKDSGGIVEMNGELEAVGLHPLSVIISCFEDEDEIARLVMLFVENVVWKECSGKGWDHCLHNAATDDSQFALQNQLSTCSGGYSFLAALFRKHGCLHGDTLHRIHERRWLYRLRPQDAEILDVKPGEHAGDSIEGRRIQLERANDSLTRIMCYESDGVSTIGPRTE